jgi:hypothetical protein
MVEIVVVKVSVKQVSISEKKMYIQSVGKEKLEGVTY